jgi:hypothetical protein
VSLLVPAVATALWCRAQQEGLDHSRAAEPSHRRLQQLCAGLEFLGSRAAAWSAGVECMAASDLAGGATHIECQHRWFGATGTTSRAAAGAVDEDSIAVPGAAGGPTIWQRWASLG